MKAYKFGEEPEILSNVLRNVAGQGLVGFPALVAELRYTWLYNHQIISHLCVVSSLKY